MQAELEKWQPIWRAESQPPEPLPPWPVVERLQPFLHEEVRAEGRRFKWRTGLGQDQLHPRHLSLVSDECLYVVGFLFYLAEAQGAWPDAMSSIAFFLLRKATGGFRTIGLLTAYYRIWARLRMPMVRAWAAKVPRAFFAAGIGKSTETAVGRLLLAAEALDDAQQEAAAVIVDIDKCYENVGHVKLREAACRHGFPLGILRLCLAMYRSARRIGWAGVISEAIFASQSLVPGCSIALWLLQLLMLSPLDELVASLPPQVTNLEVYVDDATLQVIGRKRTVEDLTVDAAGRLFSAFTDGAGLPISQTKGRVTASCKELAERIATRLRQQGYKAAKSMTVLGIDVAAGRGGLHQPMRVRMRAMAERKRRFRRLKLMGAKTYGVVRAATVPAVAYGARVIGVPPLVLRWMRSFIRAGLPDRAGGTSATLQLLLAPHSRADPTYITTEAPLTFWATAAFGDEGGHKQQQAAWKKQVVRLGRQERPWTAVAGPAGALVLTLRALGWAASSAFAWKTESGLTLDIRTEAPSTIIKFARLSATKRIWREWALEKSAMGERFIRDSSGYWLEPVRRLACGARRGWSALQAAWRASVRWSQTQWTQQRLYEAGVVDDDRCYACGEGAGTVGHRTWICHCLDIERSAAVSADLVSEAKVALEANPHHPLWTRGLMPRSCLPEVPPVEEERCHWFRGQAEGCVTGNVFTDGSCRIRWWWPESERAGWGVGALEGGTTTAAFYGPLPGPNQSTPRAELFAVCEALRVAVLPCKIHTDHRLIVKGLARGRAWCTAATRPNADLWRLLWFRLDDHGGLGADLSIVWVPGHDEGEHLEARGNRLADAMAKSGAAMHELPEEVISEAQRLRDKLSSILRWIGSAAVASSQAARPERQPKPERPQRTARERAALARARNAPEAKGRRTSSKRRIASGNAAVHRLPWAGMVAEDEATHGRPPEGPAFKRRRLTGKQKQPEGPAFKRRRLTGKQKQPETDQIRGEALDAPRAKRPALRREEAGGHVLYSTGSLVWCSQCGCYGDARVRNLRGACRGTAGKLEFRRQRLLKGRHPFTNEILEGQTARVRAAF